jgi:WXG100 family type VII secretion target
MSRDRVQVRYQELEQAAARFEQLADEAQQALRDLRGRLEALTGGGWQGEAADAHFATAEEELLPKLERLTGAYERGGQALREASATIREVDEAGRDYFRGR